MFAYQHSVLVRVLLAKAMGLPFWRSAAPRPTLWGINLYCYREWGVKVPEGGITDNGFLDLLKKWCHRCSSIWSLCPSWAALAEGQSRWTDQVWRDLGMWLDLRTPEVQWCWWVLARCVQHQHCLGLGGLHWHHRDSQRSWWHGFHMCFLWIEHQVVFAGNMHKIL